jgi:hypothetical protein
VGVLLAESTYQELIRITDELEITISEYIRDLVEKEFKEKRQKETVK